VSNDGLRGSPDDQEVNLNDTDEVRHYARLFDTSAEVLREAVVSVGPSVAKVRRFLEAGAAKASR
jgi:hypothetical protein